MATCTPPPPTGCVTERAGHPPPSQNAHLHPHPAASRSPAWPPAGERQGVQMAVPSGARTVPKEGGACTVGDRNSGGRCT